MKKTCISKVRRFIIYLLAYLLSALCREDIFKMNLSNKRQCISVTVVKTDK